MYDKYDIQEMFEYLTITCILYTIKMTIVFVEEYFTQFNC